MKAVASASSSITNPGLPEAAPNRPGRAKPASGARACSARSAIEMRPLGVDKDRIAHFNFDVADANNERRKSSPRSSNCGDVVRLGIDGLGEQQQKIAKFKM